MPRKPRVSIPDNPGELLTLAAAVYAQDQKLGDQSPLRVLEGPATWAITGPTVATAQKLQADIEQLERQLKTLYGQRQPHLDTIGPLIRASRDTLLGVYSQNPARVGDFGFDVATTPASSKPPGGGKA